MAKTCFIGKFVVYLKILKTKHIFSFFFDAKENSKKKGYVLFLTPWILKK